MKDWILTAEINRLRFEIKLLTENNQKLLDKVQELEEKISWLKLTHSK